MIAPHRPLACTHTHTATHGHVAGASRVGEELLHLGDRCYTEGGGSSNFFELCEMFCSALGPFYRYRTSSQANKFTLKFRTRVYHPRRARVGQSPGKIRSQPNTAGGTPS